MKPLTMALPKGRLQDQMLERPFSVVTIDEVANLLDPPARPVALQERAGSGKVVNDQQSVDSGEDQNDQPPILPIIVDRRSRLDDGLHRCSAAD